MLYTQWNYDEAISVEREEAYADGREAGKAEGRAQGMTEGVRQVIYNFLRRLGDIPEDIYRQIEDEQDKETLEKWYMDAPDEKALKNSGNA